MKDARLQEIREYASELFNPHRLGDVATVELLAYVDELTGERDRARDLAVRSGYFQSREDDESAGGYQHDDDRPSAYEMPVGSVVVTEGETFTCEVPRDDGDVWRGADGRLIRAGWIEGLFSDELVTEWRLG
jgi:hypothetical protein